jgi:hypothetical protein
MFLFPQKSTAFFNIKSESRTIFKQKEVTQCFRQNLSRRQQPFLDTEDLFELNGVSQILWEQW